MLVELEQLMGALGAELGETMWTEAAARLEEVIAVLRRPSDFYLAMRKREDELQQLELAALERARQAREALVKLLPRKPQVRVLWPRRRRA